MVFFLLALSIVLSTGRNVLSKSLSDVRFGTRPFFLCQGLLFLSGGAALLLFGRVSFAETATQALIYAAVYALLLILAQWFYTAALSRGNTALCSTVYSMGFILPTLSGAILWGEALTVLDAFGVLCAVSAVIVSGLGGGQRKGTGVTPYGFLALVIAMLASGGLGIVQKLQQKSSCAEQKSLFLLTAFLIAALLSFLAWGCTKKQTAPSLPPRRWSSAVCVGLFFGCCNLLNTSLAGQLDSAIFFPTLNIGVILLSMLSGILFFGERLRKKETVILLLGGASILLLNFG